MSFLFECYECETMNAKISVFFICVKAIISLLLYNLRDCTFNIRNTIVILYKVYQFWLYALIERIFDSLENELTFISGKIIWEEKTVSCENNFFVQNRSTNVHIMETWKKKNTFTEHLLVAACGYCVYFLLELKRVDVRLEKKRLKFCKETLKKTLIILHRTKNK